MKIMMNMTVIGSVYADMEKESIRKYQLEELKEDYMKTIKSKKFFKQFRKVIQYHYDKEAE